MPLPHSIAMTTTVNGTDHSDDEDAMQNMLLLHFSHASHQRQRLTATHPGKVLTDAKQDSSFALMQSPKILLTTSVCCDLHREKLISCKFQDVLSCKETFLLQ